MSAPRVVAVVLNWCNEAGTAACVDSLSIQDYPFLDILVVDNASPDESGARLRARYPDMLHERTDRNLGYTGGNNRGIARALEEGAEYVLVINNDTTLEPGAVRELVFAARSGPGIGAVGPKILRADAPHVLWFAGGTFDRRRAIGLHEGEGRPDANPEEHQPRAVTFLTGCCLLIPATVLREAGAFRQEFFAYVEDVEFCLRLTRAGFQLLYAPSARIRHEVPPAGTPPSPMQIMLRDRNRRRLVRLHYGAGERLRFRAWFYPSRLGRALQYLWRGDRARASAIVRGAWMIGVVALAAGGCVPCSGVPACRDAPHVSADGQVIEYATGEPVPRTTVEFTPAAGSVLDAPMRATTDGLGRFHLSGGAASEGAVVGTLRVVAPTFGTGYTSETLALRASRVAGEGMDLGRVLARPWFTLLGEVRLRHSGVATAATVRIVRTGGASLTENDITMTTDTAGRFYLERPADGASPLVATVTVTAPGQSRPFSYANISLPVTWRDRVPRVDRVFSLGTSLAYAIQAVHRGLDRGVPGVSFTWMRTGGIATTPSALSGTSNVVGLFSLQTEPSTDGIVQGDIVMTPPPPFAPQTLRGVQLGTFDSEEIRLVASLRFGQAARYSGELYNRANGTLQPGVAVEFRPTGGVAAQARTDTSNAVGRFLIAPYTDQAGQITGDLYVGYRPPREPEVIRGVVVRTFEDDSLRYLGRWGVGPSLLYVGELRRDDTNAAIIGAQVTFRRTGGIVATPDVLTSVSIEGGRFGLGLAPATDGEVQGTISVHAPPLRDTTIAITLPTFLSDSVRLRAVYRIRP